MMSIPLKAFNLDFDEPSTEVQGEIQFIANQTGLSECQANTDFD